MKTSQKLKKLKKFQKLVSFEIEETKNKKDKYLYFLLFKNKKVEKLRKKFVIFRKNQPLSSKMLRKLERIISNCLILFLVKK